MQNALDEFAFSLLPVYWPFIHMYRGSMQGGHLELYTPKKAASHSFRIAQKEAAPAYHVQRGLVSSGLNVSSSKTKAGDAHEIQERATHACTVYKVHSTIEVTCRALRT